MSRSANYQNPKLFWERRLSEKFDITGVGYANLGPAYNINIYQARIDALNKAIRKLDINFSGRNLLEIGCGTGYFTNFCKEQNVKSYTGVDITEISVNSLSEEYPDYHFLQADIGEKDIPLHGQFDIILIADVLYHIVDDTRFSMAIQHVSNLLIPNGVLIISDLLTHNSYDTFEHCKWRSISEYKFELSKDNLEIIHIEPIFFLLSPPPFLPESSIQWKLYRFIWRYGLLRLAHFPWFDNKISTLLSILDKKYFLRLANIDTPSSKWLIAHKIYVG
jgi:2-polyprenyl-3-methyl-5-hydroxy-6-metoxy-1,4-benzoquinol methylase